ncbi:hypothetical protein [Gordonia sihwensis]|uniref:hypothetical protein n=1 Tax=Gordonia sihwensis TaxID=173559 RepID=UPI003D99483D
MPFSFGTWFTKIDDNWPDWSKDFPEDYWLEIGYDTTDDEEGQRSGRMRLSGKDLIAAAKKIERGEVSLSSTYVKGIVLALNAPDEADLDAIGADAVLQTAIYGALVYG